MFEEVTFQICVAINPANLCTTLELFEFAENLAVDACLLTVNDHLPTTCQCSQLAQHQLGLFAILNRMANLPGIRYKAETWQFS